MSEEMIVRHCSPTLAGLKTGSMFTCEYGTVEKLREDIRRMNRRLASKGLRVIPLRVGAYTALIYIYRPSSLAEDFTHSEVTSLLEKFGYECCSPDRCVVKLISKMKEGESFPHEIGLFLGYPPEDVRGFIENKAGSSKLVGFWKVYGDEEHARQLFDTYKRCTDSYMRSLALGNTLERLAVTV